MAQVREIDATKKLQHPNIVQVLDVGEHGGYPFFALEFARQLPVGECSVGMSFPDDLRGLVHERLGALPSAARSRLLLAATAATPDVTLLGRLL